MPTDIGAPAVGAGFAEPPAGVPADIAVQTDPGMAAGAPTDIAGPPAGAPAKLLVP